MNQQTIMTQIDLNKIVELLLPAPIPTTMAAAKLRSAKQVAITRAGMVEHSLLGRVIPLAC